ncbi:MAG: single-stranded DNA-binding protein [Clostridiales bacterium]|nr:single-stranded DNA-binding protein [Clostridiales bacterium]
MNSVILTGRVTADPELKKSEGDRVFTNFMLAVPRQSKVPETDFPKVTAYGKTAENICRCLRKNSRVIISGKIRTRNITDSEGIRRTLTEILASNWEFLDEKPNSGGSDIAETSAAEEISSENIAQAE